jgi:hypothetical protein
MFGEAGNEFDEVAGLEVDVQLVVQNLLPTGAYGIA